MSYRIAGIDVHKKMLAVVVSNVEVESEFQFERKMFGTNPEQLRLLVRWCSSKRPRKWLWNQRRNIGNPCGEHWKGIGSRSARSGKESSGGLERYILRRRSPIAGGAGERRTSSMPNGW